MTAFQNQKVQEKFVDRILARLGPNEVVTKAHVLRILYHETHDLDALQQQLGVEPPKVNRWNRPALDARLSTNDVYNATTASNYHAVTVTMHQLY